MMNIMRKLLAVIVALALLSGCTGSVKVTDTQKRKFAFGAVLATRDGTGYDTLSGMNSEQKNAYKTGIDSSWGITDHDTAIETLDWLKKEGHRISSDETYYGFDEIFNIAIGRQLTDSQELESLDTMMKAFDGCAFYLIGHYGYTEEDIESVYTVAAWDYDRLITLSRWCYGLDYISEEEMWGYIDWAGEKAVSDYGSWKEYFAGVILGRSFWAPEYTFEEQNVEVADILLSGENSPYDLYAFAGEEASTAGGEPSAVAQEQSAA